MSTLLAAAFFLAAVPQEPAPGPDAFAGYWRGTLWSHGSGQALHVELTPEGEERLRVETVLPDWIYFPVADGVAEVRDGRLELPVVYGRCALDLDPERDEMRGHFGSGGTLVEVHFKRSVRPTQLAVTEREVRCTNGAVTLVGTFFAPGWAGPHPALAWVPSRGPVGRFDDRLGRARWLARCGIASVVWDKRGVGESGGDLERATFEELVGDARAFLAWMARQPEVDPLQLGVHASSAGGWAAIRLAASFEPPLAFVATEQAPATSVRDQQVDALRALMERAGASGESIAAALEWNALVLDAQPTEQEARRFTELLAAAEGQGWADFLGDGDPFAPEEIAGSWVRRHAYDPAADWPAVRAEWLAIYGGEDDIVPAAPSIAALQRALGEREEASVSVRVLAGLEHGQTEWPTELRVTGASPLDAYVVWNKLDPRPWQTTLDWLWSVVELSPATPFELPDAARRAPAPAIPDPPR